MLHWNSLADIDELIILCGNSQGKAYIAEAVACYKAGSFRACILTTWIAIVFDYIDKLRQVAMSGDSNAEQKVKTLENSLKSNNISELLNFERGMLKVAKEEFEFISHIEWEDLQRLAEDRNRCAHPSMSSVEEPYQPTAETARYHLRNAVVHFIQHPPTYGKSTIDKLVEQIKSVYFPDDVGKAVSYLKTTPLIRPKRSLIRNLMIVLIKDSLVIADEDLPQFFRYLGAIKALILLHRVDCHVILEENLRKILSNLSEEDYNKLITLLFYWREIWTYIPDNVRLKLDEYVKLMPDKDISSILWMVFQLPYYQVSAKSMLVYMSEKVLVTLIESLNTRQQEIPSEAIERSLSIYLDSDSYDRANNLGYWLLLPACQFMNESHVQKLLKGAEDNSQIYESFQFVNILSNLVSISNDYKLMVRKWIDSLSSTRYTKDIMHNIFPEDK